MAPPPPFRLRPPASSRIFNFLPLIPSLASAPRIEPNSARHTIYPADERYGQLWPQPASAGPPANDSHSPAPATPSIQPMSGTANYGHSRLQPARPPPPDVQ